MTDPTARETMIATLGSDPYERIEAIRAAGERKVRAEGVYAQLDHERKIVLAMVASEIQANSNKKIAENTLERMAYASDRYRKHIRGLAAAAEERELATSYYYALKSEEDWDRAAIAHDNVLAKLGG